MHNPSLELVTLSHVVDFSKHLRVDSSRRARDATPDKPNALVEHMHLSFGLQRPLRADMVPRPWFYSRSQSELVRCIPRHLEQGCLGLRRMRVPVRRYTKEGVRTFSGVPPSISRT